MSTATTSRLPDAIPEQRLRTLILGAGLVGAAAVAGYVIGRVQPTQPAPAVPSTGQAAVLEPEWIAGLRTEIAALREQLATPSNDRRLPATAPKTDASDLRSVAARLEALLSRIEAGTTGTARVARLDPDPKLVERLDQESKQFVWDSETGFSNPEVYDEWCSERAKQLGRSHKLWTLDEVLAAYGPPASIDPSGGRIFRIGYVIRSLSEPSRVIGLQFQFASERVVGVEVGQMNMESH